MIASNSLLWCERKNRAGYLRQNASRLLIGAASPSSEASDPSAIRALLHRMFKMYRKAASARCMLALQERNLYQLMKGCHGLLRCHSEPAFSQPQLRKV